MIAPAKAHPNVSSSRKETNGFEQSHILEHLSHFKSVKTAMFMLF